VVAGVVADSVSGFMFSTRIILRSVGYALNTRVFSALRSARIGLGLVADCAGPTALPCLIACAILK
jgi:hypothetical protein